MTQHYTKDSEGKENYAGTKFSHFTCSSTTLMLSRLLSFKYAHIYTYNNNLKIILIV